MTIFVASSFSKCWTWGHFPQGMIEIRCEMIDVETHLSSLSKWTPKFQAEDTAGIVSFPIVMVTSPTFPSCCLVPRTISSVL